jgi:hypothetical protein
MLQARSTRLKHLADGSHPKSSICQAVRTSVQNWELAILDWTMLFMDDDNLRPWLPCRAPAGPRPSQAASSAAAQGRRLWLDQRPNGSMRGRVQSARCYPGRCQGRWDLFVVLVIDRFWARPCKGRQHTKSMDETRRTYKHNGRTNHKNLTSFTITTVQKLI